MTTPRRILVIFDDGHEGDAIRVAGYLLAVRAAHPNARIVLSASARSSRLFVGSPAFDRIVISYLHARRAGSRFSLRVRKVGELVRLIREVGRGYDLVLTFGHGGNLLNVLGMVAGRRRIGHASAYPWMLSSALDRWDIEQDESAQQIAVLRAAGIDGGPEHYRPPVGESDEGSVNDLLLRRGVDLARPLVVLHPGSDWACQQWLTERWAAVADTLGAAGVAVVFAGVAREAPYIASIQAHGRRRLVSVAGETTPGELAALVARASLCVTVDAMVYELAAALGTPVVVLAGPTRPALPAAPSAALALNRTGDSRRRAINACRAPKQEIGGCLNYSCAFAGLRSISVREVLGAIDRVGWLGRSPGSPGTLEIADELGLAVTRTEGRIGQRQLSLAASTAESH